MKDSDRADELIGRVFSSLREIETPDGLEARVLRRVDRRTAEPAPGQRAAWKRGLRWASGLAVVTAAMVMVSLVLTKPATHRPQDASHAQRPAAARVPDPRQTVIATNEETVLTAAAREDQAEVHHVIPVRAKPRYAVLDIAVVEARAPSIPAPPMPLTAGEALLQQAARRGHPKIDSPLNPEVRARERLQAAAEFTDFFTPPPVKAGND